MATHVPMKLHTKGYRQYANVKMQKVFPQVLPNFHSDGFNKYRRKVK